MYFYLTHESESMPNAKGALVNIPWLSDRFKMTLGLSCDCPFTLIKEVEIGSFSGSKMARTWTLTRDYVR